MPNLPPRGWGYRAVPPKPDGQKKRDQPKPPKPSEGGPTTSTK